MLIFCESAIGAAILVALGFFLVGGRKDPFRARVQAALFAAGFSLAVFFLFGQFSFPPHELNETFSWAALALWIFVILSPDTIGPRYLLRGVFVVLLGFLTLWPVLESLS